MMVLTFLKVIVRSEIDFVSSVYSLFGMFTTITDDHDEAHSTLFKSASLSI